MLRGKFGILSVVPDYIDEGYARQLITDSKLGVVICNSAISSSAAQILKSARIACYTNVSDDDIRTALRQIENKH